MVDPPPTVSIGASRVIAVLQHQDGVMSVRAERLEALERLAASIDAHDFY